MDKLSAAIYLATAVFLAAVSFQSIFPHALFLFGLSIVGFFSLSEFKKVGIKSADLLLIATVAMCFVAIILSFRLSIKEAFYLLPLPISICVPAAASYFQR